MAGNVDVINPLLPSGATPITASSGNVAAASGVATIPAVANKTAWITGFMVTSAGSTGAAVVTPTITGIVGGTMTFVYTSVAGVTLGNAPLIVPLPIPVPATAVNTAIVVTVPSLGAGNTNSAVTAFGFYV
jgi:hypothetical protein